MTTDVSVAKQAIHDKLESQMKTAAARLDTLKAQAETAKANIEIKAIVELLPTRVAIQQKLQELKGFGADRWEQAKTDLEVRITDFQKSVERIGTKVKGA